MRRRQAPARRAALALNAGLQVALRLSAALTRGTRKATTGIEPVYTALQAAA